MFEAAKAPNVNEFALEKSFALITSTTGFLEYLLHSITTTSPS